MHFTWSFNVSSFCGSGRGNHNKWEKSIPQHVELLKALGLYFIYQVVSTAHWCDKHPFTQISKVEMKYPLSQLVMKSKLQILFPRCPFHKVILTYVSLLDDTQAVFPLQFISIHQYLSWPCCACNCTCSYNTVIVTRPNSK